MKEFIIDKNSDGTRLDKFMLKVMPNIKTGELYKALRKKKIRINGKHKDGAERLRLNDVVQIYMNDEFFETEKKEFLWQDASCDINIVYEDENIIIADKPSGMPSQDTDDIRDSLESRIRSYLYKNGEINTNSSPLFIPSLCHRIDRNTEGLVIAAKNAPSLRIITEKIKSKEIRKFYLCETEKSPKPVQGDIHGWLIKDEKNRKMIFSKTEPKQKNAGYCETSYRTLRDGSPALLEVELHTGRTHQIRAGFSFMGCPLVGDIKYGAKPDGNKTYQHLISYKIIFDFKSLGNELDYLSGKTICKKDVQA